MMNDRNQSTKKILFVSNGHGEDLNGSLIANSLRIIGENKLAIDAFPIVGEGKSYRNKQIRIVAPLKAMPSGGIFYLHPLNFLKDLFSGLIGLIIQQLITINKIKNNYDFVVAVGDVVPLVFAYLTGKNYVSFIVSTSSYYEGTLKPPLLTKLLLRSSRCKVIFTRDQYTADDLQQRGLTKALFAGYPVMDTLKPTGKDLQLLPEIPMIALVPGSRLPEALRNLKLQLELAKYLVETSSEKWQFRAALVPSITEDDLQQAAQDLGWQYCGGILYTQVENQDLKVRVYSDAFADILQASDLVLGMAGTAVEQAVGLGKPVVQIPGKGPQFTYRFAEAQMRLLGLNVITIDDHEDMQLIYGQAVIKIQKALQDSYYLKQCQDNGIVRMGEKGGSLGIAKEIRTTIH